MAKVKQGIFHMQKTAHNSKAHFKKLQPKQASVEISSTINQK